MADLTKQLGLGLAVKQANQTPAGNTTGYNYSYTNPTGNKSIAVGVPLPGTMSTGGGMSYDVPQKSQAPVSPLGVTATQSLASPSSPTSVTNNVTDSFTGIPNKKKGNIANTASQITPIATVPPITPGQTTSPTIPKPDMSGFREATMGQDSQFRSSYRKALMQPEALAPSPTGLSGAELEAYNQLTPQEQKMYQSLSVQGMKAQTDYLTKAKADMEFRKSQEESRVEMEGNSEAMAEMQSVARIEEAQRGVANLKQNIGYLGNQGQPGISSQKLDAVSNQVTLADRTLKNIIESERLSKKNREIGRESNAEVFTRQMKILQDDLDGKVNKTVQAALNQFNAAELEGKLDTIPEIEAFQQQLYAQLDYDLSSVIDTNIEARKFLIERYDKLAESQKQAMKDAEDKKLKDEIRKNTLNKEMSQALGYYVNQNGEPLVDKATGQNIVVPPESDVTYDKDSGQMVILTKNRDGTIGVQMKQVGTGQSKAPQTTTIENPDGTKTTMQWNGSQWTPIQTSNLVSPTEVTPNAITSISSRLQGNNVQCGMVSNDYMAVKFPQAPRMGDSYESKVKSVQSIGVSDVPQVGGVFAMNTYNSNGHTGIVQSVDLANGTFTATDANREASQNGGPVTSSTYKISPNFTFSKAPAGADGTGTKYGEEEKIFDAIFNFSGGASKVSEGESKLMKTRAKTFAEMGLTPAQSIVKYKGFDITKPENAEMAQTYINIGDNLSKDVKPQAYEMTVSKYINNGDMKGLNDYVTRLTDDTVKKTYGNDAILSANNKVGNDRTSTVLSLIEKNKDKIGAFDGRVEDFISKFKTDPEYQKLKTILQMNQADARKYFAGSAVTESEMKALQDFIGGTTKMTAEGLTTMLKTLQDDRNNVYSSQRRGLEVPSTGESKTETTGTQMTPERIKNIQTLFKQSLNKQ